MNGSKGSKVTKRRRVRDIEWFENLVPECERRAASDIHLFSGHLPWLRVNQKLERIQSAEVIAEEQVQAVASELLAGSERDSLELTGAVDGAYRSRSGCRFRFNIFRNRGGLSIALRRLKSEFRSLAELGLPETLYRLCALSDGLVIVAGPAGAGKSTTLATLLDRINHTREAHVVTIEEPVEFVHEPASCLIHQREVGLDASSFNEALVSALRQDPDIILIGEMRDENTIRTAIRAAETGHLVFATLHAHNAVGALERLLGGLPADEQENMRHQLSAALRAVVAQHLLPKRNGNQDLRPQNRRASAQRRQRRNFTYWGAERRAERDRRVGPATALVPACEVLFSTPAIANLIATGEFGQIYQYVESGAAHGMQTLERSLASLCAAGTIAQSTALTVTRRPKTMQDMFAHVQREGRSIGRTMRLSQETSAQQQSA